MPKIAPYGSWKSPVTPEFVAGKERVLTSNVQTLGNDIYFIENRPDEAGRSVLMRRNSTGEITEVLPPEFSVRTRYLEYGGRSFYVHENQIYFVNYIDQQIYISESGKTPRQLTHENSNRFCDFVLDMTRKRLITLREICREPESINSISAISLDTGEVKDLLYGNDFYNSTRISDDGSQFLWTTWNHPNMPWNGTELWVAEFDLSGNLQKKRKIAGDSDHGIAQAQWSHDGRIFFIGELDQWFNLYEIKNEVPTNLFPVDAEFSYLDWTPGQQQYAIHPSGTICATYLKEGLWNILLIREGKAEILDEKFANIGCLHGTPNGFVAVAGYPQRNSCLIRIGFDGETTLLYSPSGIKLPEDQVSIPEEIRFPTEDGGIGYAWFYAPKNGEFVGPENEKPPLIVLCHGGPTSMSSAEFNKRIQFWTSRGYAIVDVNYGGSSGFGRRYRERLRGNWGKVDISDCVSAVQLLKAEGKIDPRRVAIKGGSAGGYTTLGALTFTRGVFSVGASYFGISSLESLAKETHKLESRYMDQLVGPYPAAAKTYRERSPIEHIAQLNCPIIFFQGDEDCAVPPNQSQLMYQALKEKGIPTEYHLYPGEGHGFRKAETIQHSLLAEHRFYARFFGFTVGIDDQPA